MGEEQRSAKGHRPSFTKFWRRGKDKTNVNEVSFVEEGEDSERLGKPVILPLLSADFVSMITSMFRIPLLTPC